MVTLRVIHERLRCLLLHDSHTSLIFYPPLSGSSSPRFPELSSPRFQVEHSDLYYIFLFFLLLFIQFATKFVHFSPVRLFHLLCLLSKSSWNFTCRLLQIILVSYLVLPLILSLDFVAHRPGDIIPMSKMGQYHSLGTVWHDMIGRHCLIFGVNCVVLVPISKPTGFTGADIYKMSSTDGSRDIIFLFNHRVAVEVAAKSCDLASLEPISVIPVFKSAAEELLNTSKALGKSIVSIGYTEIKKWPLLTSMEIGELCDSLEYGKSVYTPSFTYGILPEQKVESIQGLALTAD